MKFFFGSPGRIKNKYGEQKKLRITYDILKFLVHIKYKNDNSKVVGPKGVLLLVCAGGGGGSDTAYF